MTRVGLEQVRQSLARHRVVRIGEADRPRAAVALLLREGPRGLELLFIERAKHPDDPWSGHMAFPGGRVDPGDPDERAAAERETLEEVGIALDRAEVLGQLDDIQGRAAGRPRRLVISAFVYAAPPGARPCANYEVESAFWVPIGHLLEDQRHVDTPFARGFPGIQVGEPDRHVVWGLTYRFLELFLARIGNPLPERWGPFD